MTGSALWPRAIGLIAFLAVCAATFAVLWQFAGGDVNPLSNRYHVKVVVPDAVALASSADVRHAGVRVGEVDGIAVRGDQAVLRLALDDDHAPVFRDARVLVRAKTLSGENYVALQPGTPQAGRIPSGGRLPDAAGQRSVQLDEILSTLDSTRRRSLQQVLSRLDRGTRGGGEDLNRLLESMSAAVREGAPVGEVLADDRRNVAALIDDLGAIGATLGEQETALRRLAIGTRNVALATASRDDRLRDTLSELPGFLRQIRTTTAALGRLSGSATPVIGSLADAGERLAPALRDLGPAAAASRTAMRELGGFVREAEPLVRDLRAFARAATPIAGPLESALREGNPLIVHLARYQKDLGGFLGILRATNETYDALGHYSRVVALVSRSSVFGVLTPEQEAAYQQLVKSGVLAWTDTRGHNAHPAPGTADDPVDFTGEYPRLRPEGPYR